MVVNLIPAGSSKKPPSRYIQIVTKSDNSNILSISTQEIPGPKDPVLRPGVVAVAPKPMNKHKADMTTSCYLDAPILEWNA